MPGRAWNENLAYFCLKTACMNKKDAARLLFMEGLKQGDIAKLLRIAPNTVSAWKASGEWEEKRIGFETLKDNSAGRIMRLIDYQIRALEARTEEWRAEAEAGGGKPPRLIERGDIDALQKLWTTVKAEQRKWGDYVSVLKEFMDWLSQHDIELAKSASDRADYFLNEKRKVL